MTLKSDVKFGEKLTLGSKNDRKNLVNFNVSSGKSENLQFDALLLLKVYYVLAKKSAGELCVIIRNIWRRTDLCFEKWHEESGIFWTNTLMGSWKSPEKLCVIILKINVNFEVKMTCGFINGMRNLMNFNGALKNCTICTFRYFFCLRHITLS